MLHWQLGGCRRGTVRKGRTAALRATVVAALLAVASATMAAAPENGEPARQEPPARQGTSVLGVLIGQPEDAEGVIVMRVMPGSPAARAGIEPGDRIVKLDTVEVASPEELQAAVRERAPGDEVEVSIVRDGESQTKKVRLGGTRELREQPREQPREQAKRAVAERTAWLGVRTAPARSAEERGVIVERVFPGSPADAAGLRGGDAILRVDKTRVEATSDLQAAIAARQPEETVRLVVRRDGERKTVTVTLGTFADWHRDLEKRTEHEIRDLLRALGTAPFGLAEEAPAEERRRRSRLREEVELPKLAVARLAPTEGHEAKGTVLLRQTEDGVHLTGEIRGLEPGLRGFHIHEYGDLRGPDGSKAGGHFNPEDKPHGGPGDEAHHAGDLGNIEADEDGVAKVDIQAPWLTLHYVIGRALIVHGEEDDLETQPTGDAGARVALGVIGIANPEEDGGEEP